MLAARGGTALPPRYRLRERAALASNKRDGGRDGGGLDCTEPLQSCTRRVSDGGEPSVLPLDAQGGIVGAAGALSKKKGVFSRNEELSPKKPADVFSSIQQCGSPTG